MALDFAKVAPTVKELADWRKRNPGRAWPSVNRVECISCHRRIWGSGLGIGAHRRACKGGA